jgi:hypothetical protein
MTDTRSKRLYVHRDRSSWAVVTETEDGFLHEYENGDRVLYGDLPPDSWELMVEKREVPTDDLVAQIASLLAVEDSDG